MPRRQSVVDDNYSRHSIMNLKQIVFNKFTICSPSFVLVVAQSGSTALRLLHYNILAKECE